MDPTPQVTLPSHSPSPAETCKKDACATFGEWVAGECSVTCGVGSIKSTRTCSGLGECEGDSEKTETCEKDACATYGEWVAGECSVTCGVGSIKSTRTCS